MNNISRSARSPARLLSRLGPRGHWQPPYSFSFDFGRTKKKRVSDGRTDGRTDERTDTDINVLALTEGERLTDGERQTDREREIPN